ncbi:MAG: ferritin-like domain-containing protein [Firmicutes bacterium]|nr:ferritin-like domain-containing protein [Bacillota bacterium]
MTNGTMYYTDLPSRLLEYIHDETSDSLYYRELANQAPNQRARELFMEFSEDEAQHAANFRGVYCRLTGMQPMVPPVSPPQIPPYCDAIKARIMAESGDLVKYGEESANAPDMMLRNLFYITSLIEGRHGLRLTTLMCGVDDEKHKC